MAIAADIVAAPSTASSSSSASASEGETYTIETHYGYMKAGTLIVLPIERTLKGRALSKAIDMTYTLAGLKNLQTKGRYKNDRIEYLIERLK